MSLICCLLFGCWQKPPKGDDPYFITGAGGTLQAIIMGFAGVDLGADSKIKQSKNALPPHWKKITVKGIGNEKLTFSNTQ